MSRPIDKKKSSLTDVGHAQALDRLGFYPFEDWLRRYAARVFAVHLHDAIGIDNHLAPGLGEIDFSRVATYLSKDVICTVELEGRNTPTQVKAGIKNLADQGGIRRC